MKVKAGAGVATVSTAARLLAWYDRHARTLPWRVSPAEGKLGHRADPYRVWLSEVMLQQTTVATVTSYFQKFLQQWPTVDALAAAPTDAVMGAWAGLGYYARARNLHACAKAVVALHGSRFPATAAGLRTLPGVGDYTSAAVAAIAFGEPVAVVDGNIERVVSRLYEIDTPLPAGREAIRQRMQGLTPAERPGDFAQAMMDLGSSICTPKRPACALCPIDGDCAARQDGTMEDYPVKAAKRAKPARRGAAFVAVRPADGAIWLQRRAETGMLGGMAEPPTTDWRVGADGAVGAGAAPFPADWRPAGAVVHVFTHFTLTLEVWRAELRGDPGTEGWWAGPNRLGGEALPTLMKKAIALAEPRAFPPEPVKPKRSRMT